jgi:dTDP-glucose pyrophosphorylase
MLDHLLRCKVSVAGTIADGLRALEESAAEIALVVDDRDHLFGTLTDGDVRRALLAGASLNAPIDGFYHRDFTAVSAGAGRAEVMDLMRARRIAQIPIIDEQQRLIGLHLLHEIIGGSARPNWAVVMAGGRGTRLRPLTDELPKPMIRVAGRPILERIVLQLVGFGIRRVFLSINHLGAQIESHFGDGRAHGCSIEYLREDRPLGTGGSLSLLQPAPTEPLIVMNGDLVTEADLGAMLDFHAARGQVATIGVRRYCHTIPFGCLELDDDLVTSIEEKPNVVRAVNAGIYVLDPSVVARVPREPIGLPSVIERCFELRETVRAFEIEADWIDIGRPDQLKQAMGGES